MRSEEIILGIDPGTRILGFGVVSVCKGAVTRKSKKVNLVDFGIVNLKKEGTHFLVLQKIIAEVSKLIRKYKPACIAIEAPFYGKNPQVMLKLGRAQGAAISAGLLKDIPIFEYAPRSVKLAVVGNGSATKEQVSQMVQSMLGFKCEVKYLDATDALAIALCHYFSENSISTLAAKEDNKQRIARINGKLNSKGAAGSLRMGKKSLSSIKSASHKGSWEDFVKSNPERMVKSAAAEPKTKKKN